MNVSLRAALATLALAGVAALSAPPSVSRAAGLDAVTVGTLNSSSNAPFLIADKLGFFREEGIQVKLQYFASGATMMAPLGAGQLDVGGGAPAAGIYNAMGHGIDIKIVADRGTDSPGYGFNPIVVRKDLVANGKYKRPRDLKGMKIAEPAKGSTAAAVVEHFLAQDGVKYDEVQHVYMAFPEQVAALKNGSIDATDALEPWATVDEKEGIGVRVEPDDKFYPYQQVAVVLYAGSFMKNRPDVAKRFMVAYLKGVRYYKDSLKGGHIAGKNADEVIRLLSDATHVPAPMLRAMTPGDINEDGKVNVKSLKDDYAMFKRLGFVSADVNVDTLVDMSYVEAAAKQLGPYKP
jgi:NitT/TauT family transport system substrate-binding protein